MPEGVEEGAVIDALHQGWDFDVDAIVYAAVGAGSYHWEVAGKNGLRGFATVDDLDQRRAEGHRSSHGEPHAGNVMRTSEGCVLVDRENDDTLRQYGALRDCAAIRDAWAASLA
jgi:hypothetical protein